MKFLRDTTNTGGVSDPEAADIDRRAQDVVKFGRVKEVDYKRKPPSYRVEIGDSKDEDNYILTDWLPATGARAKGDRETHYLEVGEKVALLAEGGELSTAYVMPAGQYTEDEEEKETTDKAGVWKKVFKDKGEISYDRESHTWMIDGTDKGELTVKAGGCSIHFKDGTITIKAKNLVVEMEEKITAKAKDIALAASGKFESKASESHHEGSKNVKLVGKTFIGLDDAGEEPEIKIVTEAGPAGKAFAKPG